MYNRLSLWAQWNPRGLIQMKKGKGVNPGKNWLAKALLKMRKLETRLMVVAEVEKEEPQTMDYLLKPPERNHSFNLENYFELLTTRI